MKENRCPVCGKEIPADSTVCPACGAEIGKFLDRSKRVNLLLIVVLVLVAVALAVKARLVPG